jgi:ABC-type polysaccharide/polyol phosphate export permease
MRSIICLGIIVWIGSQDIKIFFYVGDFGDILAKLIFLTLYVSGIVFSFVQDWKEINK